MANTTDSKSIKDVINEIKNEVGEFATTRYQMLVAESKEKFARLRTAATLIGVSAVIGITAFFVFTYGLVALAAAFFGGTYAWAAGAGAVFLIYAITAAVLGLLGYKKIKSEGIAPQRTLQVLKQDQIWIKNEARSA